MAQPTIVPPAPTVVVPSAPGSDNSPGMDVVQKAFDRVFPPKGNQPAAQSVPPTPPVETPPQPKPAPETPPKPSTPDTPPVQPTPSQEPKDVDVPSFLEQALRGESPTPAAPPAEEEWPEELPEFKSSDDAKARYKKWREAHKTLREELKKKPATDPVAQERLAALENQNKAMHEALSRVGVEQSVEFQETIMRPLHAAWSEAARIVRDNGVDPQQLARAMSLTGRAQFEALDGVMEDMPESARTQVNDALRVYRQYEGARQHAIANAPKALQEIRRRETERQLSEAQKQREDMKSIFDHTIKRLRDDGKLEVLLKTDMPEGAWWNDQGENIVKQARELYLENTDMNRVAMACLLAPAADVYRKLWINSQKKIGQLQKVINQRVNGEPNLSESGGPGNIPPSGQQLADDLKRPFHEVFLREFHNSQSRNR